MLLEVGSGIAGIGSGFEPGKPQKKIHKQGFEQRTERRISQNPSWTTTAGKLLDKRLTVLNFLFCVVVLFGVLEWRSVDRRTWFIE